MTQNHNTTEQSCCKKKQHSLKDFNTKKYLFFSAIVLIVWLAAYQMVLPFGTWVAYSLLQLPVGENLGIAIEFFIYDTLKIFLLLTGMVYLLAWLRASLSMEKVRNFLTGKKRLAGYSLGATFGAITPFCSCSSIPLFVGFTASGIPLGITMSFLITSPLINEVAVVILWGLLGWKFTIIYVTVGIVAGIVGGFIMDITKAERWLQPFLLDKANFATQAASAEAQPQKLSIKERHLFAKSETFDIFRRVWLWVIIGVGVGAALHGFVPDQWIAQTLGQKQWWSVPAAVAVGIPLYTNVTGIIPVMESLLVKGLPLGTTLALCMSTVAVSLPEILMLKQVMRCKLLLFFIAMMLVIFSLVGWLFNALNFSIA